MSERPSPAKPTTDALEAVHATAHDGERGWYYRCYIDATDGTLTETIATRGRETFIHDDPDASEHYCVVVGAEPDLDLEALSDRVEKTRQAWRSPHVDYDIYAETPDYVDTKAATSEAEALREPMHERHPNAHKTPQEER